MDFISYGNNEPVSHQFKAFHKINLLHDKIDYKKLAQSDVIIYASGAGIQSNVKQSYEAIFELNTFLPIKICKELSDNNYQGFFVTFGSYFEIGNNSQSKQFTELDIANSIHEVPNDYCVSKRLLTRFANSSAFTFNHLHLILPTIYGEMEGKHRLIPYTISSIKENRPMQFTSGKQVRQYLFVGDVPKIIFELIAKKMEGIYNISGTETHSVREIVEMICDFYGLPTDDKIFGTAERYDIGMQNLQLDSSLIKNRLPNIQYTSFLESLKLYDQYY